MLRDPTMPACAVFALACARFLAMFPDSMLLRLTRRLRGPPIRGMRDVVLDSCWWVLSFLFALRVANASSSRRYVNRANSCIRSRGMGASSGDVHIDAGTEGQATVSSRAASLGVPIGCDSPPSSFSSSSGASLPLGMLRMRTGMTACAAKYGLGGGTTGVADLGGIVGRPCPVD